MNRPAMLHRSVATGAVSAACIYFLILPIAWPQPQVTARIPDSARITGDLSVEISIFAWHRNFDVQQVRFYVDDWASSAKGEKGLFNPMPVLEREAKRFPSFLSRNPFTWPSEQRITVSVPLGDLAEKQLVGPGILEGKIDVTFTYAPGVRGRRVRRDATRLATQSVPFRILINE